MMMMMSVYLEKEIHLSTCLIIIINYIYKIINISQTLEEKNVRGSNKRGTTPPAARKNQKGIGSTFWS